MTVVSAGANDVTEVVISVVDNSLSIGSEFGWVASTSVSLVLTLRRPTDSRSVCSSSEKIALLIAVSIS